MKKQLLMGMSIVAVLCAYPQTNVNKVSRTAINAVEKIEARQAFIRAANENPGKSGTSSAPVGPQYNPNAKPASSSTITWNRISGSMNIYGMLEISGKPLQYNDELDAVSFVHRKSQTYVASPAPTQTSAATGVVVGMVSTNCGTRWDSTCIWNNNSNWARYPQGGLYNPPGNTDMTKAHIVASGPITAITNSWVGSYLASKRIDIAGGTGYDNVANTTTGAQQFVANTAPFGPLGKFDYPSYSFASTDDGYVRTLGIVVNDFNGTGSARQYRGARVIKGICNSTGTFNWSADSIIVAPLTVLTSVGNRQLLGEPHMAWNESGTVGYVVHIGCLASATSSVNSGFQPIIYKYTSTTQTWTPETPIDFNQSAFSKVLKRIEPVLNTTVAIPFFNIGEGLDCVVDKDDHLHIVSTVWGTRRSEPDSLGTIYGFNNWDGEQYSFGHTPGRRPYIFDFMQTASGWDVAIVDSMSSEAPGERPGENGFGDNPWDAVGGANNTDKVISAARIQASRTPDGRFIVYSWAESDTAYTTGVKKWNNIPNLKARAYDVQYHAMCVNELTLTTGANAPLIAARAQMHHISPKCSFVSASAINSHTYTADIKLPITVSTNQGTPLNQLLPNDHWYSCAPLTFVFRDTSTVGIKEEIANINNTSIFPNPARGSANLKVSLQSTAAMDIQLVNALGETIRSIKAQGQVGENNIEIDLKNVAAGIYFVKIGAGGNQGSTKKLIVE